MSDCYVAVLLNEYDCDTEYLVHHHCIFVTAVFTYLYACRLSMSFIYILDTSQRAEIVLQSKQFIEIL